jgi:hypothetical protein
MHLLVTFRPVCVREVRKNVIQDDLKHGTDATTTRKPRIQICTNFKIYTSNICYSAKLLNTARTALAQFGNVLEMRKWTLMTVSFPIAV